MDLAVRVEHLLKDGQVVHQDDDTAECRPGEISRLGQRMRQYVGWSGAPREIWKRAITSGRKALRSWRSSCCGCQIIDVLSDKVVEDLQSDNTANDDTDNGKADTADEGAALQIPV